VVDHSSRVANRRVRIDRHHGGVLFGRQCADHGIDGVRVDERFVPLDVDVPVGMEVPCAFCDSIRPRIMQAVMTARISYSRQT